MTRASSHAASTDSIAKGPQAQRGIPSTRKHASIHRNLSLAAPSTRGKSQRGWQSHAGGCGGLLRRFLFIFMIIPPNGRRMPPVSTYAPRQHQVRTVCTLLAAAQAGVSRRERAKWRTGQQKQYSMCKTWRCFPQAPAAPPAVPYSVNIRQPWYFYRPPPSMLKDPHPCGFANTRGQRASFSIARLIRFLTQKNARTERSVRARLPAIGRIIRSLR